MKAVLQNGLIYPREPLPKDWRDGTELHVEKAAPANQGGSDDVDDWMARVQAAANDVDPEDEIILEQNIRAERRQARELARKEAEKS